jgi:PAS domain S-box-containing protein/putative nucleotidyltransferase with HDIG domain
MQFYKGVIYINAWASFLNAIRSLFIFINQKKHYGAVFIAALILGSALFVYSTGGIKYVFSHSMYLPILLSALLFGLPGGLIAGLVGGLVLGPLMPVDVLTGEAQLTINWVFRCIFFMLIGGVIGQAIDVLNAKNNTARRSEQEFRSVFELVSVGIVQINPQTGRLIQCNQKYTEITGYREAELFNMNILDLTHPEDQEQDRELFFRAMNAESSNYINEKRYIRKDGKVIWVCLNASFIRDETGQPVRTVAICEDITDRKAAEDKIVSQNDILKSIFNLVTSMRTAPSTDSLLNVILKESCRLLHADDGTVMRISQDRKRFIIVKALGLWVDIVGYSYPVTEGLSSKVYKTGEPYKTDAYRDEDKEFHFLNQAEKTGSMLLVPLKAEEELIGVLEVSRRLKGGSKPFSAEEVELLSAIGEVAGNALRRQALFDSAQNRLKQLQGLRSIDIAIAGSLDLDLTFTVILNEVTTLLDIDAAAILQLEKNTFTLRYEAGRGFYSEKLPSLTLQPGEGYAGQVIKERKALHINDLSKADHDPLQSPLLESEHFATYYAVPLIAKGRIQGVLEVYHREKHEPDEEWLEFLQALAGQTAIAIDNAELFQSMEKSNIDLLQAYDATIEGWAYALDLKDEETEDHSQRVTRLTMRIARKMEIKEELLPHIKRGALLHDIGKMGVPDSILLKPGPLTEEEWVVMRKHPVHAYEMLSRIDYLRPALDIPYCHHEKFDGTGYPRGLKGEEIPLPARIFAVIDVYDALISDRPYRPAWSIEKTLQLIKEDSGTHFDPEVVEAFLAELS